MKIEFMPTTTRGNVHLRVAAHLNEPIEPDEHEEHPTEATQDEGRRAELFDEGNPRV